MDITQNSHQTQPIDVLNNLIHTIHFDCYKLCKIYFGRYFENIGNIGIFCQSDDQYYSFLKVREEITEPSGNPNQKYFKLFNPIAIPATNDMPEAVYTYLYIRKPDPTPYGKYLGDIDFIVSENELSVLLKEVKNGEFPGGVNVYGYGGNDMVQLTNPDIKSVAYISTKEIAEGMRVRKG